MNKLNGLLGQFQTDVSVIKNCDEFVKSLHFVKEESLQQKFEDVQATASYLLSRTVYRPQIAIICGSGLGGLADLLNDPIVFDYKDIPNFPLNTVKGHAGKLLFGKLRNKCVVCMQGRFHAYEGHSMWKVTFPVRVLALIGVKTLIVTNACGGLNPAYHVGDVMIMKDHINLPALAGLGPQVGLSDERFGPRFTAMSTAYDKHLRVLARQVASKMNLDFIQEGVYFFQVGPCFESVAECRFISSMGADVTGMSTAPEVLAARQCGVRCLGISLVTNMCIVDYDTDDVATHEETLQTAQMRAADLQALVSNIVADMSVETQMDESALS